MPCNGAETLQVRHSEDQT